MKLSMVDIIRNSLVEIVEYNVQISITIVATNC